MFCSVEMHFPRDMILVDSSFTDKGLKRGELSRQEKKKQLWFLKRDNVCVNTNQNMAS